MVTFLHLVDPSTEKDLKRSGEIWRRYINYNHLVERCRLYYQPDCNLSIDERRVRSKARFSFKQYIRNKPCKWRFKLWCLCDPHNGYTIKFSNYRGKTGETTCGKGLKYPFEGLSILIKALVCIWTISILLQH